MLKRVTKKRSSKEINPDLVATIGVSPLSPKGEVTPTDAEKPKSATAVQATENELREIQELLQASASGSDLGKVRERRKSKDTIVKEVAVPDTTEKDEINGLLQQASHEGKDAFRQRRKTKSGELGVPAEGTPAYPVEHTPPPPPPPPSAAKAQAQAPSAAKAADAKKSSQLKQKWKDAAAAMMVNTDMDDSIDSETSSVPSAFDIQKLKGTAALTGAAARGARAAALKRVQTASEAVGGVFLTKEVYEAMRQELKTLRIQNKRLQEDLTQARLAASPTKTPSPTMSHRLASAISGASPFGVRAPRAGSSLVTVEKPSGLW